MYSIIWLVLIKWGLLSSNRSVVIKWCFGFLYRKLAIWENTMAGHAWPSYFPMPFFDEVWCKKIMEYATEIILYEVFPL